MINRYTQPVQHQFIPTQPNPQLLSMMMQKRSQDEAQVRANTAAIENDLLGVRAYRDEDKKKLESLSKNYTSRLSDIYDRTNGNPTATLVELNALRREYEKDKIGGDIYDINYNYSTAMGAIKDANERFGKGEISAAGKRYQIQNASTDRVGKDPQIYKTLKDQITSKEFDKNLFKTPEEAYFNIMNLAGEQFKNELSYMTPQERAGLASGIQSLVYEKYNTGERKYDASVVQKGNPMFSENSLKDIDISSNIYNKEGNIKDSEAFVSNIELRSTGGNSGRASYRITYKDGETKNITVGPYDKIPKVDGSRYQDKITMVNDLRDKYNIDPKLSDEKAVKILKNEGERVSALYTDRMVLNDSDDIKFYLPDLRGMSMSGKSIYLDGEQVDGDKVQGLLEKVQKQKNGELSKGRPFISLSGENPGGLTYNVTVGGKQRTISIVGYKPALERYASNYKEIIKSISEGDVGKGNINNNVSGQAKIKDKTVYYDGVEIVPRKNGSSFDYDIFILNNGERIKTSGKDGFAKLNLNTLSSSIKEQIKESYRIK